MSETPQAPQALSLPPPSPRLLRIGWLCVSLCELALAFAIHTYSVAGFCPTFVNTGGSCAPLIRPRLADLGPVSVSQLALAGATLTFCFCLLAVLDKLSSRLKTVGAGALAAGAGFAVALQILSLTAAGSLCPLCLALACIASAVAFGMGRSLKVDPKIPGAAFAIALLLFAPLTAWRGNSLAAEDAARRAAVQAAGGDAGPRLLLVTRDGCPYCDAFELDVLGDPAILEQLSRTRGVKLVGIRSAEANALKALVGAPTLVALDASGKELGRVEGLKPVKEVEDWLADLIR